MSLLKQVFSYSLVCLLAVSAVTADEHLEAVTLQLKWKHQFQFAGYYAAVEKGFYQEAGFDVTLQPFQGEYDLFSPVLNGDATFGIADSSIVVRKLLGEPLVVLSTVFQHSPLVLISLSGDRMLSPYELRGKRIMFQQGVDDASIQAMLASAGITSEDYELVPHTFDNFALLDDQLDLTAMSAYLSNQPYLYRERGYNVQIINPANYGVDFYGDLLYTSEDYVRQHPERAIAFRDATIRGWHYALNNSDEVISWLTSIYNSQHSIEALRFEATGITQMVSPNFVELGSINPARFRRIAQIYQEIGLAPVGSSIDGLTLSEYLDNDAEERARLFDTILILIAAVLLLIGLLALVLYALRKAVRRQTHLLQLSNQTLLSQLKIVDQHVASARISEQGQLLEGSSALCSLTGYQQEELIDQPFSVLLPNEQQTELQQRMNDVLKGFSWQGEFRLRHKDGHTLWVDGHLDPMANLSGKIDTFRFTANDITEKKSIEMQAELDALTGIANRIRLDRALSHEWSRYERYHQDFSLILFDLDHFKRINDNFGHLEGDKILRQVGEAVAPIVRTIDVLGRWGGEEFLIVLPQTDLTSALAVAEKVREAIMSVQLPDGVSVTSSCGVATSTPETSAATQLLELADKALYQAKANGRNQVQTIQTVN